MIWQRVATKPSAPELTSQHIASWLGDSAILFPGALVLALILKRQVGEWPASAWICALLICTAAISMFKLVGYVQAAAAGSPHVASVSGHVALAATFYGGLWLLAGPSRFRAPLFVAAATFVLAVAADRIASRQHSIGEVAAGVAVGALSLYLARRLAAPPFAPVAALLVLVTVLRLVSAFAGVALELEFKALGAALAG